jgi:hypothetical protein
MTTICGGRPTIARVSVPGSVVEIVIEVQNMNCPDVTVNILAEPPALTEYVDKTVIVYGRILEVKC